MCLPDGVKHAVLPPLSDTVTVSPNKSISSGASYRFP